MADIIRSAAGFQLEALSNETIVQSRSLASKYLIYAVFVIY